MTFGVVDKSGSHFSFDGNSIGHGMAAAVKFLEENGEIAALVEAKIREKMMQGEPEEGFDLDEDFDLDGLEGEDEL